MLTPTEKLLFALLVAISFTATYNTFNQMALIIGQGKGELNLSDFPRRLIAGIIALFSQGMIIRHRKISSIFHYGVAWGFIFYGLVNLMDILEGVVKGFHFFEDNIIGQLFRLTADLFSVAVLVVLLGYFFPEQLSGVRGLLIDWAVIIAGMAVLVGVVYFLVRRFVAQSSVLTVRENVKLIPKARKGVRQDSLVVGLFILFHVLK